MTTAKRQKPRRRHKPTKPTSRKLPDVNWSRIKWLNVDKAFTTFEPESLISLISAAADSPGCAHRLPSLTLLWLRALIHTPHGVAEARAPDLPRLLVSARKAAPQLRHLEDCWNSDPRLVVCQPVGRDRLRIHPGAYTDPLQLVRIVASTATAIDPLVTKRYGFSLSDLLDAALRYSHWRLEQLSPAWPTGALARDEPAPTNESLDNRIERIASTPATIRQVEVDVVRAFGGSPEEWTSLCARPERAAAAWEWATVTSDELDVQLAPMAGGLGTTLGVQSGGHPTPVPASLVLSGLAAATGILATEAAGDAASVQALRVKTAHRVLGMFGTPEQLTQHDPLDMTPTDEALSSGVGLGMTIIPDARHAVAFCTVSGLDVDGLTQAIDDAESLLSRMTVDTLRESGATIEKTASVYRLVLYGGPLRKTPPESPGTVHLHIEDLASMMLDAQRSELGQDLIYQFLDELTTMPGIREFFADDFLDVWRHWQATGVLNPSGEADIPLQLIYIPDDSAWLTAAAWEPIESVLTAAGLPVVSDWYIARLDDRGHATLYTHQAESYLVLADPPLIISTSFYGGLADLGLDLAFGLGLADGLLLTCTNFPDIALGLTLQGDRPLIVRLEFTADRPQESRDDLVAIGFRTASQHQCVIDLLLGPDWLELLATDPRDAHHVLGHALARSLDQLQTRHQHPTWDVTRASFTAAWDAAPPVAILHIREEVTLNARPKGKVTLPRSHATRARARRRLASAVLKDRVTPCQLLGRDAQDACRNEIMPAVDRALRELVADWSEDAVISVAEHLNDAHGERARAAAELEMALSAPWGAHWQSRARDAPDPSHQTRPLEYLLELLVVERPTGSVSPDRFDIAEAADLAHLAIQIGVDLSGANRSLHSLTVRVGHGGMTDVIADLSLDATETEPAELRNRSPVHVDIAAYLDADRAHRFRLRDAHEQEPSVAVRLDEERTRQTAPFAALASLDVPGSLRSADRIMLDTCGTGLDGINAVLGTAVSWTRDGDPVVLASRAELHDEAQAWSSLPAAQVEAALDRLILDPDALHEQGIPYWEQDQRRHRLTVRPLVPFNDQLIIIPWQIYATQSVYLRYISEGRLPWHSEDVPDQMRNAFNDYRRVANLDLERAAARVATDLHLPHKSNVHPNDAAALGLKLPGEVDLLIADAARSRIWVCEVKDVSAAFSPRTIMTRIRKFLDDEDYISKLSARAIAVRQNPDAAAQFVAAPTAHSPWRVIPLMITRTIEAAAFLKDVPVTFTVLNDLAATLQSDADPDNGHTPVGE